ncbi:MAG: bifunctional hydroxymethylpyrimidine kinase/phosphomethylpyrimidine kinase, partial [Xanthobacteraceae bacterium]|nr:bifunctional hydroxymethylpyrimidine kinase/phosphomethylpyrimidine kinase [Xanthobacteraceae bacterium]
ANPNAAYCCDPVIGNRGRGVFVDRGVSELFREHAIPLARIVTPNHFELDRLVGDDSSEMAQVVSAIGRLHARGPAAVLVTSVEVNETPPGHIDVVASDGSGAWLVRTPKLAAAGNGAGDIIAALFLYHSLRRLDIDEALARSTSSVFGLLERSPAGAEIALVAAQDELVTPTRMFVPQWIGA